MKSIGIFGGSFDPIHRGHLHVAHAAREGCALEQVFLMPACQPPHKLDRRLTDARHRLAMVRLAVAGDTTLGVLDDEVEKGGTSYTIDTLEHLQGRFPDKRLMFVIGSDSLGEIPTWHRYRDLASRFDFITIERRTGEAARALRVLAPALAAPIVERLARHVVHLPPHPASSTDVRDRLASGHDPTDLVPEAVLEYIHRHGLYGTGSPDDSPRS